MDGMPGTLYGMVLTYYRDGRNWYKKREVILQNNEIQLIKKRESVKEEAVRLPFRRINQPTYLALL